MTNRDGTINPNPGSRLKLARHYLNLTLKDFGSRLGVTATTVQRWESANAELSEMACRAIEQSFAIRHEWLLTGEGAMWTRDMRITDLSPEVAFIYRPLIPGAATCGPNGEVSDPGVGATRYALPREHVDRLLLRSGGGTEQDLFFLRCSGDSMRPTLQDGEIVLLNAALSVRLDPRPNGIYLVRRQAGDGDTRVKRLRLDAERRQLVLSSDNRAYPTLTVDLDGTPLHQLILGRVIWVSRDLLETDPPTEDW